MVNILYFCSKIFITFIFNIIVILFVNDFCYSSSLKNTNTSFKSNLNINNNSKDSGSKKISILIDDVGNNIIILKSFLKLKQIINYAVLPECIYTKKSIQLINNQNIEFIAHIPMEPIDNKHMSKDKTFLTLNMSKKQLSYTFNELLNNLKGCSGFNNHMGSKFTADSNAMKIILKIAKSKNLFYIDSYTSGNSVGFSTALEVGVPTFKRNIFIDNKKNKVSIINQLNLTNNLLEKNDNILLIGHLNKYTLNALAEWLKTNSHLNFVKLSDLIKS